MNEAEVKMNLSLPAVHGAINARLDNVHVQLDSDGAWRRTKLEKRVVVPLQESAKFILEVGVVLVKHEVTLKLTLDFLGVCHLVLAFEKREILEPGY